MPKYTFRETLPGPPNGGHCELAATKKDCFILLDGEPIAKRGQPGTPWAKSWITMKPGITVIDENDGQSVLVLFGNAGSGNISEAPNSVN